MLTFVHQKIQFQAHKNNMNRIQQLKDFLKESPDDPFLRYAIALEHLKIQEDEKALDIFRNLLITNPMYVGTYYHIGKLQEKMELFDDALDSYEKGMTVAKKMNDRHSFNELQGAFNMLNDELEEW